MDSLVADLTVALRDFDLVAQIECAGETTAIVGPSGAGKSTLLRAVAGLVRPAAGRIALGDQIWFDSTRGIDIAAERRRVGYVFQHYALFPHLSVERNVAFGGRRRVAEMLERVGIAHLAPARPGELSGGERQRVAIARALASEPRVLLLDEPLAALDTRTRASVRGELRTLLASLGLPALIVSHDFEDAATLARRVGVLARGRVLQIGEPSALVARPANATVAELLGANVLVGEARAGSDGLTVITLSDGSVLRAADPGSGRVGAAVLPWDITIARSAAADSALNRISAAIESIVELGNRARVRVGPLTAEITIASLRELGLREDERVHATFKATATRVLPL